MLLMNLANNYELSTLRREKNVKQYKEYNLRKIFWIFIVVRLYSTRQKVLI